MIPELEQFFLAAWLVPSAATQLSDLAGFDAANDLKEAPRVQVPGSRRVSAAPRPIPSAPRISSRRRRPNLYAVPSPYAGR